VELSQDARKCSMMLRIEVIDKGAFRKFIIPPPNFPVRRNGK
jgi:hypothetical protein